MTHKISCVFIIILFCSAKKSVLTNGITYNPFWFYRSACKQLLHVPLRHFINKYFENYKKNVCGIKKTQPSKSNETHSLKVVHNFAYI